MLFRALIIGLFTVLAGLLAGCSDQFLDQVQSTSDDLDTWFEEKGIAPEQTNTPQNPGVVSTADSSAAEATYQQGLALKREGAATRAVNRFLDAAQAGHAGAAYELAQAYLGGNGVTRNDETAAHWLNTAAERGEPRAQYMLGAAYYGGLGVERDDALALHWLGKAATGGLDRAQYLLAEAFANGRGVTVDMAWAARWYGKAARQGHARAQLAYGLLLAGGRGLPANATQGYTWLTLAADNGLAEAEMVRMNVGKSLEPDERAIAEANAKTFRPGSNNRFADPPTVMFVQFRLWQLGFETGGVDGLLGPTTRNGIYAYQNARGRRSDGQLTPDLLVELLQEPMA